MSQYPCCFRRTGIGWGCRMVDDPAECRVDPQAGIEKAIVGAPGKECVSEGGCWDCDFSVGMAVKACFEDPDGNLREHDVTYQTYLNCGGSDPPCVPEPQPADCREAADDRPAADGLRWTFDRQAPIAFGLSSKTGLAGRVRFVSAIRARTDATLSSTQENPCQYVGGRLVVRSNGFASVRVCSQPTPAKASQRVSYAVLSVPQIVHEDGDDETEYLKPGYTYALGCYATPFWGEAIYRSYQQLCEGPEE